MKLARLALVAACAWSAACANAIVRPAVSPIKPATDALLVLPGFGYGSKGEQTFRSLARSMAADGIDLYLPTFISRSGLDESRARLQRFVRDQRLERYERVHVFAFLAGGWTFNPLAGAETLPNLTTVVYDRSPFQERAPRVAMEKVRVLAWLKFGSVLFDVARTPYPPLDVPDVRVGLVVETVPTPFIKKFAKAAEKQGPYSFQCDALNQRYDDCLFVAINHNDLYERFADVWPDVRAFIREGRFTAAANRTPPSGATRKASHE
jgi:hypothetical protein